ncbi:MAG TPA: hypothetical protein VFE17_13315, partial [Candidatus Baltobacteraceae bacterium]|nr:hypothetical protein [Candidatus Baltobacteraceae bacterium]
VRVTGTKIHFYNPRHPIPYSEIDYGEKLLWAKPIESDVIIAYKIGDHCSMHRRRLDASTKWILTHPCDDKIIVADDDRSLTLNGTRLELPNKLRCAGVETDSVLVIVYTDAAIQGRNAYRYNRDGTLKWQIGERRFDADVPFTNMGWVREGTLKAEGFTENRATGAIVDYETGEIVEREDPR